MLVLVANTGAYHGHVSSPEVLKELKLTPGTNYRLLKEEEWAKVIAAERDKRAELCSTLGEPLVFNTAAGTQGSPAAAA